MPTLRPLLSLALLLTACSQTAHSPAAQPVVSIETRLLIVPAAAYTHLSSQSPQLFPTPDAPPSSSILDNFQLSRLLDAANLQNTSTITVPRATAANHHTARIPITLQRNFVHSLGTPPIPSPPMDTHSTLTVTPTLTSDHRIRLTLQLAYTPLLSGPPAGDNLRPFNPADRPARIQASTTLATKQVALLGPYPTTDAHGQPAQLLILIRPNLILPQPTAPPLQPPPTSPPPKN